MKKTLSLPNRACRSNRQSLKPTRTSSVKKSAWHSPMLSALRTLQKNFSAVASPSKRAEEDCPISRLTAQSLSRHESWATILIKLLCSPSLPEMQNRSERKYLSFILHRPCKILSNSKTLSAVWWIWMLQKKKAKVLSIGQRNTISKTQAEPICRL